MKMHIEIASADELAMVFAIIRGEPLEGPALAAITQRLHASATALQTAEDAAPKAP